MKMRALWLFGLLGLVAMLWAQTALPQNLQRQYDRAVQLARQGKHAQAEPLLREVVRQKPDFAPARLTLGLVYRMMNQPDKAVPHLRRAGELDPRNPTPLIELCRIALDRSQLDEAEAYLRTLRTRFPNHEELPLLTGALHMIRGQWQAAYDQYQSALKKRPNDFRIHYNLGIAASQLNKPDTAIRHLERSVQLKPNYATGWKALGLMYEVRQRVNDALRAYSEALKYEPDDLPTRLKRAMLYQRAEQWEQALADFAHAAKLYPRNPEASLGAGLTLMRLDRYAEARRYLGTALSLFDRGQPLFYDILAEIAHCELKLKNYGKAREYFAEVLRYSPKNTRAYEGQLQVLQAQEVEQELLPFLRRWAENLPDDPRPLLTIAQIYERSRRYDLAEPEYANLVERFPNDSTVRLEYAKFLSRQGRHDEANAQYDLLLSRSPKEVGALFAKARTEERRGAYREALQLYEQVLQVDATNTPALLGKAAMHRRLGELEPAIQIYRQLTFQPEPNLLALSNLVNLYEEANRTDELIAFLRECVQKLGQNYLNLLVAQLIKAGRAEEAIREYQTALQREPNNYDLWRTLGLVYEQMN
ncbi:MAG: tetratricopeptide repeat protein, partial [Fimbriimonadales bacterium]